MQAVQDRTFDRVLAVISIHCSTLLCCATIAVAVGSSPLTADSSVYIRYILSPSPFPLILDEESCLNFIPHSCPFEGLNVILDLHSSLAPSSFSFVLLFHPAFPFGQKGKIEEERSFSFCLSLFHRSSWSSSIIMRLSLAKSNV